MSFWKIAGLAVAAATVMFAAAIEPDTFVWKGKVPAGRLVEVKGINGGIHAEASLGDEVEVIAQKIGRFSDPTDVRVQIVEYNGGITVCAVYPSAPNECKPGSGGLTNGNDVRVEFTVRIPNGVRFAGRTINGNVEATSLAAEAEGHTVNGNVTMSTAGSAQADTVNGSIVAALGAHAWPAALKFSTVNGSITLGLPAGADAAFHASTVHGSISSGHRFAGHSLSGTLGRGGHEINLTTVNGSICLKQVEQGQIVPTT